MPHEALITVTDAMFAEVVLQHPGPVVVDFWADWCPPCRPVAALLADLAGEFRDRLVIASVNADENPRATRDYQVMSMPTLLFFRAGIVVRSIVGARPKAQFRQAFEDFVTPYVNR